MNDEEWKKARERAQRLVSEKLGSDFLSFHWSTLGSKFTAIVTESEKRQAADKPGAEGDCDSKKPPSIEFRFPDPRSYSHITYSMAESEMKQSEPKPEPKKEPFPVPAEIVNRLDKWVIGQEEAKRVLACGAYYHFQRIAFNESAESTFSIDKSNICLVGPTGSGKTLLLRTLAEVLNVPFVTVDATELTPDGYVGTDVGDFVNNIKCEDDQNPEHAIVFIDEVDKLAAGSRWGEEPMWMGGGGSSGSFRTTEIQQLLLKVVEGKQTGRARGGMFGSQSLNTSNMLFVIGGAFSNMTMHPAYEGTVTTDDLVSYGLMPEFVGRFPVIAVLEELTEDALVQVLTGPEDSLVRQYQQLFRMSGVELTFSEEALRFIASRAVLRGTGARGLRSIMEAVLSHFLFSAPSNPEPLHVCEDLARARVEVRC